VAERRARIWLVISAALLFLGLWVFLFRGALFAPAMPVSASVSGKIPSTDLISDAGEVLSFEGAILKLFDDDASARYTLIVFWATWCTPCLQELPLVEKRLLTWESSGTRVLLVNFDNAHTSEDREKALVWLRSLAPSLKTIFDPRDSLIQGLEISALPFNALVDRNLNWIWSAYGSLNFDELEKRFISPPQK